MIRYPMQAPMDGQTLSEQTVSTPDKRIEKVPISHNIWFAFAIALCVLTVLGFLVMMYRPKVQPPPQYFVPPSEPTLTPTRKIMQEITVSPPSSSIPVESVVIPLLSTEGWKPVSNDEVSFLIPPDTQCVPSEMDCERVLYTWYLEGRPVTSTVYVDVQPYKGGSRRAQFLETDDEILNCKPLYVESLFGTVTALQIGSDGGMCQGGGGGIVTVVGDKLIIFRGLSYHSDTKQFPRFGVRDTIISTLR